MADKISHNINEHNIKQNQISDKNYYPIIVSYHSNIISRPLIDTSTGEFVKVKSTGKVKLFGQTYFKKDAIDGISTGRYKAISTCNTLNESLDVEDISFVITTGGTINMGTGSLSNATPDTVSVICQRGSTSTVNCIFLPKVNNSTYVGSVIFQYSII